MIDDTELRDLDPFDLYDGEAQLLDDFLAQIDGDDWLLPTRCEGWRRRELLAHLAASEEYNHATLDDNLPALFEKATQAGAKGIDGFNAWGVERLADAPTDEVLQRWRADNARTRREFRKRGWDGTLTTSVGPYPAGLQAFHLAMELAIHAGDMDMPVADADSRRRGIWQPRFARFSVREYDRAVSIEPVADGNRVSAGDLVFVVDDADLVDACAARLPADHPMPQQLRDLLRVFA